MSADDATALRRCGKCRCVRYCSEKCQLEDWKSGHKHECSLYAQCLCLQCFICLNLFVSAHLIPSDHARCLLRMIIRYNNEANLSTNDRTITDLMTHQSHIMHDVEKMKYYTREKLSLYSFVERNNNLVQVLDKCGEEVLFHMHCRLLINGFLIGENMIGTAIYVNLSRLDHSCQPNCHIVFIGRLACLRFVNILFSPITTSELLRPLHQYY